MPSFQLPGQSNTESTGNGFNFAVSAASNPFAQTNGASATPPPTTFQFGAPPSSTMQNGAGVSIFGNGNHSFGSTFGAGAPQTQQNGFTPSTNIFGQDQNAAGKDNASTSISLFGQSSQTQPQQNGLTPKTNDSFPSFGKQDSGNPFKSFGQTPGQTQVTANTSFTSQGQDSQPNGDKAASTPFKFGQTNAQTPSGTSTSIFGSTAETEKTPKPSTGSIFANFRQPAQQNGAKSLFAPTSQVEQTSQLVNGGLFGGQRTSGRSLFGATPPPEAGADSAKPGESIFSSMNASKKDTISSNMFTQSRDQTPQPSTNNVFGQKPAQGEDVATEEQQQPNGVKSTVFGSVASSQAPQPTAQSSTTSLFGGGMQQQTPQKPTAPPTSPSKFGQPQQDTSMTTPGNTPQKTGLFASASEPQPSTTDNAAKSSTSLFGAQPPSTQKPLFQPSTTLFNGLSAPNTTAKDTSQQTPAKPATNMFSMATPREQPSTAFKPSFTPSASFANPPADKTAAPWLSHAPAAAAEPAQPATVHKAPPKLAQSMNKSAVSTAEKGTLKALNEGLQAHLATQRPDADWSSIMQYYLQEAAKIQKGSKPSSNQQAATSKPTQPSAAPTNMFTSQPARPIAPPATPTAATTTSFGASGSKPAFARHPQSTQPPKLPGLIGAPQTAPVNRKRPVEEDFAQPPVTEKRPRPAATTEYPKLPENASQTAKLFQEVLNNSSITKSLGKPAAEASKTADKDGREAVEKNKEWQGNLPNTWPTVTPGSTFTTSAASDSPFKPSSDLAPIGFTPLTTGFTPSNTTSKPSTTGYLPATTGFTPSTTGFKPFTTDSTLSTSGFKPSGMPTFSAPAAGTGGFMAAFGKRANEEEEKERKKRKMEDYDSDEETEEAWAERDKQEQEAKRLKILDAAKAGAGFTPSAGNTPAPESDIGEGSERGSLHDEEETDNETSAAPSKSLFDRITPRESPAPSQPNLFSGIGGNLSSANANPFAPKIPSALGSTSTTSDLFNFSSKPRQSIEPADADTDKTTGESEQGSGDNTWKPNTPIKFGAAAPTESTTPAAPAPAFSSLFGSIAPPKTNSDSSGHLNVPKPFSGFNFGGQLASATSSRASTPGMTTDGEGHSTAGEEAEEDGAEAGTSQPAEPQVEDQTGLRDSEKENETLLFSVHMAKAMKYGEKKTDDGELSWGWVEQAKGPLYILKHKESGRTRVVLKVPPYGKARMNFEPLARMAYEVMGGGGKMVQGAFVDHLDSRDGDKWKLGKWLMQVGKAEDAKEMARVLMANRPE